MFPGLQFIRTEVDNATSMVNQSQQMTGQVSDTIRGFVPQVQQAWIGGDADAFAQDVLTVLLPAIAELMAAIGGININLSQATSIVDQADQKCQSMASQLGDQFGGILGGGGGGGFGGIGGGFGGMGGIGGALGGSGNVSAGIGGMGASGNISGEIGGSGNISGGIGGI